MKISELSQISAIRRDIRLPLSIAGQNMSITLGQIIDATSTDVVPFGGIYSGDTPLFALGSPTMTYSSDKVVFFQDNGRFYLRQTVTTSPTGKPQTTNTFFAEWPTAHLYNDDEGEPRTTPLYVSTDGRLYKHNGITLISAGLTEEQAKAIIRSTPIKVASETEMEQRIATGEYEDGQLYYIAETE